MNKKNGNVGRPLATINWPNRKFTFPDLVAANTHVAPVTLRGHLKKDASKGGRSEVVIVKGELRDPDHEKGLGRKLMVYIRRSKMQAIKKGLKTVSVKLADSTEIKAPTAAKVKTVRKPAIKTPKVMDAPSAPANIAPVIEAPVTAPAPEAIAA